MLRSQLTAMYYNKVRCADVWYVTYMFILIKYQYTVIVYGGTC